MHNTTSNDTIFIFEQKPDDDTFGGRLSRARDAAGSSSKDLAGQLSVSVKTVRGWENDRAKPSAQRMTRIAGLLGVSLSWLLHGVGQGPVEISADAPTDALNDQLTRLQALHADTGDIIVRLQADISRLEAAISPSA